MNWPSTICLLAVVVGGAPSTRAQFVAVGGGMVSARDRAAPASSSDFQRSALVALDAGTSVLPFVTAGVHYSFTRPEVLFRRNDMFGSRALLDLGTHTLTFDARLRTPTLRGWRLYGLAGVGLARFNPDVKSQIEVPFPGAPPKSETKPVFTFGGGVEHRLAPLVREDEATSA